MVVTTSQPLYPRKETQYPMKRRLEGPQGWSEWEQKITSPTGILYLVHAACSQLLQCPRCPGPPANDTLGHRQYILYVWCCRMLKVNLVSVLTYLLTPWCRVLLEQLTGLQLVKKFPAFHGTRRFITALTSVCHLSNWFAATQEIPLISRNPKVHYHTQGCPPPVELVCSYSRNSPHFTEPEGSLPHSQASATCVTGLQLLKKFPAFHGTRRFITALTSVRHLFGISPSEDNVIHFRFSSKEPRELCRASRTRCEVAW